MGAEDPVVRELLGMCKTVCERDALKPYMNHLKDALQQ